jgi:hypothetical protein
MVGIIRDIFTQDNRVDHDLAVAFEICLGVKVALKHFVSGTFLKRCQVNQQRIIKLHAA